MSRSGSGRLAGRSAIVTGAGSRGDGIGNGRAISILFAREGARLALVDANAEWLGETARRVRAEGGECIEIVADVADEASVASAVSQAAERLDGLDTLINNVGISGTPGTATTLDPIGWERDLRINLTSMMLMSRHALAHMEQAGVGSIVHISSIAGLTGGHPSLLYPTSKSAVIGLTQSMAIHHGPAGIRVNCVAPGYVHTPMVTARGVDKELRERRRRANALQTEGTAWDVGHATLFLASDEARWITGAVLPVDGGTLAGMAQMPTPPVGAPGLS